MADSCRDHPVRRRRLAAACAAVFLLALGLRALPAPVTLRDDGVSFPAGADEMWHMRRIAYIVANFPDPLHYDYYMDFPQGRRLISPPGFDLGVAALVRLLVGPGDRAAMERVAAWVPPVLGAGTASTLTALGWTAFAPSVGATAGVLLAVLPGHFFQSQIGIVDHHVAVVLGLVLMLWLGVRCLAPSRPGTAWLPAIGLGLVMGGVLHVWTGWLLHVFIVQGVATAWLLAAGSRRTAAGRAGMLAVAHAMAALCVLPWAFDSAWEQFGLWSALVPSRLQPAWLGAGALLFAVLALGWRGGLGSTRRARIAGALGAAASGAALAVGLAPGLLEALGGGAGFFGKEDRTLYLGAEVQPLLFPTGTFELGLAGTQLSYLVLLFPLGWVWLAVRGLRRGWGADRWLVMVWAGILFAGCLSQIRFVSEFIPLYALTAGMVVEAGGPLLRRVPSRGGRAACLGVAALVAALAFAPAARSYQVRVQEVLRGERMPAPTFAPQKLAEQSARWLRTGSPATQGYLDASLRPEYGVLCSWSVAHLVRYRAERPTVHDARGVYGRAENAELAWNYYAERDEEAALAILERLDVRYVLADPLGAGTAQGYAPGTMTHRLATLFGSAGQMRHRDTGATRHIPALAHHRLVYLARLGPEWRGSPLRIAGVWERVRGARVEGRGEPGDRVEVELPLHSGGRSGVYRAFAPVGPDGRWALTLPYPNDVSFSSAVSVGRAYLLVSARGHRGELVVPEAVVQNGATLEGPALVRCPDGGCPVP